MIYDISQDVLRRRSICCMRGTLSPDCTPTLFWKHGGVQKSMDTKLPWKIGMLIYLPVTTGPLIVLQNEVVFIFLQLRDHPFRSLHSEFLSPSNFATYEMEDPFATPHL